MYFFLFFLIVFLSLVRSVLVFFLFILIFFVRNLIIFFLLVLFCIFLNIMRVSFLNIIFWNFWVRLREFIRMFMFMRRVVKVLLNLFFLRFFLFRLILRVILLFMLLSVNLRRFMCLFRMRSVWQIFIFFLSFIVMVLMLFGIVSWINLFMKMMFRRNGIFGCLVMQWFFFICLMFQGRLIMFLVLLLFVLSYLRI